MARKASVKRAGGNLNKSSRKRPIKKKVAKSSRKRPVRSKVIYKKQSPINMVTSYLQSFLPVEDRIELIEIKVPCMDNCGNEISTTVNSYDIVPHLGRPRGMRLRCNMCNVRSRGYNELTYGTAT